MVSGALTTAFPELAGREAEADPTDPRRRAPVRVSSATRAPVAAIVFVRRAETMSIRRLAPVESLAALVRQSPWVILNDRHSPFHLAALKRVATVPSFLLSHTPAELHGLAGVLDGALPQ